MNAAGVVENLRPMGRVPENERQARQLTGLSPEQQRQVYSASLLRRRGRRYESLTNWWDSRKGIAGAAPGSAPTRATAESFGPPRAVGYGRRNIVPLHIRAEIGDSGESLYRA
jgi:hypothetical protein